MRQSTSIHHLNADRGLNLIQKPLYLFLNWVNNLFPYHNIDPRIEIRNFNNENWKNELTNTYQASSVGRRLSDLFWQTLPWQEIKKELGEIHVFDTGCGSGGYGVRINKASGGVASYTGVDAKEKPNWGELRTKYPHFNLIKSTSSDINSLIPREANLFITQSAIEHFDEDLRFFEQIREFIGKNNKPVIQIHNFPGAAILPLYLFHGVRQYTPRMVSKITKLFQNKTLFYLYKLGGSAAKRIQFKYFTWPLLILRGKAKWSDDVVKYDSEVIRAIEHDALHPVKSPLFWVLIIHSNPKNKIW